MLNFFIILHDEAVVHHLVARHVADHLRDHLPWHPVIGENILEKIAKEVLLTLSNMPQDSFLQSHRKLEVEIGVNQGLIVV